MKEVSTISKRKSRSRPQNRRQQPRPVNKGYGDAGASWHKKATKGFRAMSGSPKEDIDANNYTLPDASASVKGGVTVGTNVDVSGGKISVKNGTTNQKGVVQLSSATDDTSTTKAATPSAVKAAYDLAAGKQSPATSLAGYGIADAYTKDEVDAKMSSALEYKGSKDTYADLPTTGNKKGDVWNIVNADAAHGVNAGDNVSWNGTTWDVLAGTMDLSAYMLAEDLVAISNTELDNICK